MEISPSPIQPTTPGHAESERSTTGAPPLSVQAGWILIAKIFAFAFTIALPIVIVRRLDQVEFGLYKQAFLVVNTALTLLPMGVAMSAFYYLPRRTEQRSQVVFNILMFHVLGGAAVVLVLTLEPGLLAFVFNSAAMARYAPWIAVVILFWLVSSLLEGIAIANQDVRLAMVFIISANGTKAVFMIVAVSIAATVHALILAAIAQGVLQTFVLLLYLRLRFGKFWSHFDWPFMRAQIGYVSPFSLASILYHIESELHRYVVSRQFGPAAYAIYSIGCFQVPLVDLVGESVSSVTIPRVSHLQSLQRRDHIIGLLVGMIRKLAALYLPLCVFLLVTGREFLTLLFTEAYITSWPIFAVNLASIPLAVVATACDPVLRAYAEHRYFLLRVRTVLLFVLVGGLWWGIREFGLVGAITAVVGVAALEQGVSALKVIHILGASRRNLAGLKDVAKIIASACAAGVLAVAAKALFLQGDGPLTKLIVCGLVFFAAYMPAIILLGAVHRDELETLRQQVIRMRRYASWVATGKTLRADRERAGELLRTVFGILLNHRDGLVIRDVLARIDELPRRNRDGANLFEEVMRGCIAPIKAGWLISKGQHLFVSEAGELAYRRHPDPVDFIVQAGTLSMKGWISVRFPKPYYLAGKVKDQLVSEVKAARRIGFSRLMSKAFSTPATWETVLPVQAARRVSIPGADLADSAALSTCMRGVTFSEGGHAIYLPPESFTQSVFRTLADSYPPTAGLKIVKVKGGIDESRYVEETTKGDSLIHLGLVHNHRHLTLVANLLHIKGVGPRLYDLIELQCGTDVWTAYVMEHVGGGTPSMSECEAGIQKLRELETAGLLQTILPEGFDDEELTCPSCSNNAFVNRERKFQYIDFQNFVLVNYESFLEAAATEASDASHFGDTSILRGGRYLYQSIPGVALPGKRGIDERMSVLSRLMKTADRSVRDRLVLDVGCNIGMMMAQYLKLGARWCHGWDRPHVVPHTEKLLLALGCTRFSTTGTDINQSRSLEADLPSFLRASLDGCAISYLAVRGHLGWLDAVVRIPWSFMIYEGHEGETRQDFERDMEQLEKLTDCEVRAVEDYVDGDSEPRTVAILARTCQ